MNNDQAASKQNVEIKKSGVSAPAFALEYEKDVLSQFKANLAQVEELNQRLRFVLGEVNHLIKKR